MKYEVGLSICRFMNPVLLLMTCEVLKNNQQHDGKCSAGEIQLFEMHNLINDLGGI